MEAKHLYQYELDSWEDFCMPSQNIFPAYKYLHFGTSLTRDGIFVFNGRRVHHAINVSTSV